MSSFGRDNLEYANGPRQGLPADGGDVHEPAPEDKPPVIK